MKFKFLPHKEHIKFQSFGKDLNECFENAALALSNIITKEKVKSTKTKKIRVQGKNSRNLLYNYLEEILILIDVYDLLISNIKSIKILGSGPNLMKRKYELEAEIMGDDIKNYKTKEIKSITYKEMSIHQEVIKGKFTFVCQVVVDV